MSRAWPDLGISNIHKSYDSTHLVILNDPSIFLWYYDMTLRAAQRRKLPDIVSKLSKAISVRLEQRTMATSTTTNYSTITSTTIFQGRPRPLCVLAPMVRTGELPTRLMALKYGADLVWGEPSFSPTLIAQLLY